MRSYHWDIGGIENSVMYSACKALYGLPIYGDPESGNYDITQYAPAYYHFLVSAARTAGLKPFDDLYKLFIAGRVISLAFCILGAFVVQRMLSSLYGVDRRISWLTALAVFLTLTEFHFSSRPDSLFFLTGTVVVYCFSGFLTSTDEGRRRRYLLLGILASSVSIYVKQTGIQYLAIIPLSFLAIRMYRETIASAAGILLTSAVLFMVFHWIEGPYFAKNAVGGINNGLSILEWADTLTMFMLRHQLLVTAAALSIASAFSAMKMPIAHRFLCHMALGLLVFAVGSSTKDGSWFNYYTEFTTTVLVLVAVTYDRLRSGAWADKSYGLIAGTMASAYFLLFIPSLLSQILWPKVRQHFPRSDGQYASVVKAKKNAAEYIRSRLREGEYFLSFDRHVELMLADRAVLPNKEMFPDQARYDYSRFHDAVENGTVRFFLFNRQNPKENILDIDFSSFDKVYEDDHLFILEKAR